MKVKRSLACSFCGRRESEVAKLVAGPRVYICDRCVAIAKHIMDRSDNGEAAPPTRTGGLLRRMLQQMTGRRMNRAAAAS